MPGGIYCKSNYLSLRPLQVGLQYEGSHCFIAGPWVIQTYILLLVELCTYLRGDTLLGGKR